MHIHQYLLRTWFDSQLLRFKLLFSDVFEHLKHLILASTKLLSTSDSRFWQQVDHPSPACSPLLFHCRPVWSVFAPGTASCQNIQTCSTLTPVPPPFLTFCLTFLCILTESVGFRSHVFRLMASMPEIQPLSLIIRLRLPNQFCHREIGLNIIP